MGINEDFLRIFGRFPTGYERAYGGASVRGVPASGTPFKQQRPPSFRFNRQTESTAVLSKLVVRSVALQMAEASEIGTAMLVRKYAKGMLRSESKRKDLTEMHERLAKNAQRSILNSYKSGKKRGRSSYRMNDTGTLKRYSGGALSKALENRKLFISDATGIGGINIRLLDSQARQWYRLNFGALPRSSKVPGQGSFKLFGQIAGTKLSLRKYGPSKPFFVPNSIRTVGKSSKLGLNETPPFSSWSTGSPKVRRGKGSRSPGPYIYVYGKPKRGKLAGTFNSVLSKGITGTRFLDAGIQFINNNYGGEFTKLVKFWDKKSRGRIPKTMSYSSFDKQRSDRRSYD